MNRPKLLDCFCGAGGAAVGYARAGFDVVGIDNKQQPRYPFQFIQGDALDYIAAHGRDFDAIHASPPCQRYSAATAGHGCRENCPDLVAEVRCLLEQTGRPFIIENVDHAPLLRGSVVLCGVMFSLKVFRHRIFEGNFILFAPGHIPHRTRRIGGNGYVCVVGGGSNNMSWKKNADGTRCRGMAPKDHRTKAAWSAGMGIYWMTRKELTQAIPPAYTEYIGRQLLMVAQSKQDLASASLGGSLAEGGKLSTSGNRMRRRGLCS